MGQTNKNSVFFRGMVTCAGEQHGGHPQIVHHIKDICPVCDKITDVKEARGHVKEMFRIRNDLKSGKITLEELSTRLRQYDKGEVGYL